MKLHELDTPALTIDLDVMHRNLDRMGEYCRSHHLELRPHTKTHKIPELARQQLQSGATGLTVAKIGEAEVMSQDGLDDLLLAYPPFGETKARRLHEVLERSRLAVSLDSEDSAEWTSRAANGKTIDVLVELDLGMRRCGVSPGGEAVELARRIEVKPGLRFAGIMFYPGHLHPAGNGDDRALEQLNSTLQQQLELFRQEKIPVQRVSGGSTPSAFYSHCIQGLTEIRPGTYIFNDRNTIEWKACTEEDCAASILARVVSTAVPGQAIIDAGSKTFTSDLLRGQPGQGFGLIKDHPDIEFFALNEEHGYLRLPAGQELALGQFLQIIPNHICVAVNMHEQVYGYRGSEVLHEWPVKARGKIR
ncbi:MAG: D-TA family PLP-dependent enzyme [Acidobacteriota bacterium]